MTARGAPVARAPREIPWEALAPSALTAEERAIVGGTWRERMRQEHLAVGAFAQIAWELAQVGCGAAVLELAARAAADEVRHGLLCGEVASRLLGPVPARLRGTPRVPKHAGATASARVLFHVVEMCCLGETLTGVYFAETLRTVTNPAIHATLSALLEDEIDHGKLGWAYLAERAREGTTNGLSDALPAMLTRTFGRALRAIPFARISTAALVAHGCVAPAEEARICKTALRDVVFPGFRELGIDARAAEENALIAGWV